MPIMHLFPPANTFAIASDHDYLQLHPEDQFLLDNMVCKTPQSVFISSFYYSKTYLERPPLQPVKSGLSKD